MPRRVVPDTEPLWRALADPTRRAVLDALRAGPRTTSELTEAFPTTRFAVMKHLSVLVEAGLVTVQRRGRERINHLNPVPLRQTYERWVSPAADAAADAVLRLAAHVDAGAPPSQKETTVPLGLDVRAEHRVAADPQRTWTSLMALADWWPPCWSDAERLVVEPRLRGGLGTTTGDDLTDTGELWGVITHFAPGRELTVDGTMGLPGPVLGRWTMTLTPDGAATRVTVEHRVLGDVTDDDRAGFTTRWPQTLAALAAHAGDRP